MKDNDFLKSLTKAELLKIIEEHKEKEKSLCNEITQLQSQIASMKEEKMADKRTLEENLQELRYKQWIAENGEFIKRFVTENVKVVTNSEEQYYVSVSLF